MALPLFVGHMLGTFGALVLLPDVMFQNGNPLLLTTVGEFVVKNGVFLAAGIAVATRSLAATARTVPATAATARSEQHTIRTPDHGHHSSDRRGLVLHG